MQSNTKQGKRRVVVEIWMSENVAGGASEKPQKRTTLCCSRCGQKDLWLLCLPSLNPVRWVVEVGG